MPNKLPWFSHDHDAHQDQFLCEAIREFGHVAYSTYFILLECLHWHGIGDRLIMNEVDLARACKTHRKVLHKLLHKFQLAGKISWTQVGNKIDLQVPKFLKRQENSRSSPLTVHCRSLANSLVYKRRVYKSTNNNNNDSCAEPITALDSAPKEAVLMVFPTRGQQREWGLVKSKAVEWEKTFPGLSVPGEMKLARQWLRDNPGRQKTSHGMTRFLYAWLARRCNGK